MLHSRLDCLTFRSAAVTGVGSGPGCDIAPGLAATDSRVFSIAASSDESLDFTHASGGRDHSEPICDGIRTLNVRPLRSGMQSSGLDSVAAQINHDFSELESYSPKRVSNHQFRRRDRSGLFCKLTADSKLWMRCPDCAPNHRSREHSPRCRSLHVGRCDRSTHVQVRERSTCVCRLDCVLFLTKPT
jgi:hypothetical protein